MMPRLALAAAVTCASVALADIVVSRTVDSHAIGTFNVTVEGQACTDHDEFGSNTCDLDWGATYTIDYGAELTKDIGDGDKVSLDLTLEGFIPFKAECNLCGQPCTITIPIVKQTITIDLPDCPIKATSLRDSAIVTLPVFTSHTPLPLFTAQSKFLRADF